MRSCGSCNHFTKWINDKIGGGLCEAKDARTKADYGKNCKLFKHEKYKRIRVKLIKGDNND